VRAEATLGERKSALIPAMIEPCERPILFELIQTADLTRWTGDQNDPDFKAFLEDVRVHVEAARAREAGQTTDTGQTVEATYWASIKDGADPHDFESYLRRYPNGHFADVARRRVAELRPAPTPQPTPQPRSVAAAPAPAAPPRAPTERPARRSAKGNGNGLVIGGVALVALVALGAGAMMMNNGSGADSVAVAPQAAIAVEPPAAPVETAAVVAPEPEPEPVAEDPLPDASAPAPDFTDCDGCPRMVRLAAGSFQMGALASDSAANPWERPQRAVSVQPFAISATEVTFAQWDACVADGGCRNYTPGDRGWGRDARPVMSVSWDDANAYAAWLSRKTGRDYRLPTEAEWEYAARGGAATVYVWGDRFDAAQAVRGQTQPAAAGAANGFGVFDVAGNVREWVEDCYVNTFANAPTDGAAVSAPGCRMRVVRGASWRSSPGEFRVSNRARLPSGTRDATIGFRVASAP
jgi:formylglycine-generating enzyme required for sulfatase activity